MRLLVWALLAQSLAGAAAPDIVAEVRSAIARNDFARGEQLLEAYRSRQGVTPQMIEALSWLGRGALAARHHDQAESYARQTRDLALAELARRALDAEPHLPLALGASIEVQAHVMDARGERGEAVSFLRRELERYRNTSIRTRIQKNINLLSLEGKPAPPLEISHWLGPQPLPLEQHKGHAVLLFFWAHWCADCKRQAPDLARLTAKYGSKGLVLIGPTQRYGYAARGEDATSEQETSYIDAVRKQYYASLAGMAMPVNEENFKNYGASTTPTLVLIDRRGIVRLYHPGNMAYDELAAKIEAVL